MDRLLKAGADVNIPTRWDCTLLQAAAENGHETIVNRLPKAGADVNKITRSDPKTALEMAADNGHKTIVDRLLKAEAHVNIPMKWDCTLLQAATERGCGKIVNRLLKAGADVDETTRSYPETALMEYETVMNMLLKAGGKSLRNEGHGRENDGEI